MYPDRPAGRRKGQADRSTNPSGRTGHKHRMSLVYLVHLVYLVCLVVTTQVFRLKAEGYK
jgi:hypothetical protein